MSGKLIVIEGGDSSGKATQSALLTKHLESVGHNVSHMDFPRYKDNSVGGLIRECLDGKHGDFIQADARLASVLYAADRRESLPQIRAWLDEGQIVVLDRYTSANLLHQGAKVSEQEKRKEMLKWIHRLEHEVMNLPKPDLLLYLDVPAPVRLRLLQEQGRALDLAEENAKHQEAVDVAAVDMMKVYENSKTVTCMHEEELLSPDEIAKKIINHLQLLL